MPISWSPLDPSALPPSALAVAGVAAFLTLLVLVLAVRARRRRVRARGAAGAAMPASAPAEQPVSSYERLRQGLAKTRSAVFAALSDVLARRTLDGGAF